MPPRGGHPQRPSVIVVSWLACAALLVENEVMVRQAGDVSRMHPGRSFPRSVERFLAQAKYHAPSAIIKPRRGGRALPPA